MHRLAPLLLLAACPDVATDAPLDTDTTCAWSTQAHAAVLAEGDWTPTGPDALARPGDLLLANAHAAFVIQGPDSPRTYYHYGGIPIDAVPMSGCTQTAPETFGEVGILPASLNLLDFNNSSMRQFRADRVEVIDDGSDGGTAHVRFVGTDDRFWLVDHALTRNEAQSGGKRPLSGPLGIEITVDYRLPRDRPVLEVDITVRNTTNVQSQVLVGALMFPSDLTPWQVYTVDSLSFGGFGLQMGVPWFSMSSGETAYAFAMDTTNMSWTNVSGANALLDAAAVLDDSSTMAPAGQPGDAFTARWYLATAPGAENAATTALHASRPTFNREPYQLRRVSGRVTGGQGPAIVDVLRERPSGSAGILDQIRTAEDGTFSGMVPDVGVLSLRARSGTYPMSETVPLASGLVDVDDVTLALGPVGGFRVEATDGTTPMPAEVNVYREGVRWFTFYAPPGGETWPIPVGDWEVSVTRGYEFEPLQTAVTITEGGESLVQATLLRVVDTEGWVSVDGHVHTSPSPDSTVLPERRFATVAAAGLEVMMQTDHEIIVDLQDELAASPWAGFLATVLGEEVTATNPEHLNMFGITVSPEDGARGNPVRWYGRDIAELYQAMRERGAGVVQMNHPEWMNVVRYDGLTGAPLETDPTRFGFEAGQALWSWDMDAIEIQNGFKFILGDASRPGTSGLFRAWQSFFNLGHRVTGMGASDVHGMDTPGEARTYVPSSDALDAFVEGPLLQAILEGRALTSTGAFVRMSVGNDTVGFDASMGDTVTLTDDVTVRMNVQALSGIHIDHVYVFANCDVVAVVDTTDPDAVVKLDDAVTLDLDADAHITLVVMGSGSYPRGLDQPGANVARAITNPVFVDVDGNGVFDPPGGKACDLGDIAD